MISTQALGTYLNAHLAGANAGVEMAARLRDQAQDLPGSQELGRLVEDIDADRDELRTIIDRVGVSGHPLKRAIGRVAGATHQAVLSDMMTGDENLTILFRAEALGMGIDGKLALWEVLLAVVSAYPFLADVDLPRLIDRARDQRARVEAVRLSAARQVFATPS